MTPPPVIPSAPPPPAAGEPTPHPPFAADSFPANPEPQCDIVMKGGITSGVVYPLAVCELARTYRIRSVGGASAGAIAAAVAAAAEMGRRTGGPLPTADSGGGGHDENAEHTLPAGFLGLSRFPELLTQTRPDGKSLLFHLFRPQPQAERLFGLVTGAIERVSELPAGAPPGRLAGLAVTLARGLIRRTRLRSLLGSLPGLLLVGLSVAALITSRDRPWVATLALVLALLVGIAVAALGMLAGALSGVLSDLRALPSVGYGLTAGRGASDSQLALTPWLHRRIQELAALPYDRPLTMGNLYDHDLNLQVMTTNLNRAQPMTMPWDDRVYFFEPAEFERLFGPDIVQAMLLPDAQPCPPSAPSKADDWAILLAGAGTKRPFPRPNGLPVIVATRMSLSFPLLISAVPLYTVDWVRPGNQQFKERARAWRKTNPGADASDLPESVGNPEFDLNWFSDGGLTSNLPVQFFDSALPTRPTFAIDLAPFPDGRKRDPDERGNSYLPDRNSGGLHRRTARWQGSGLGQLVSFGTALVQTARNWVDEAALVMPGYRDRVVTVYQDKVEGGLNLSMPKEVVERLSLRGRFAAERLVAQFDPEGGGWPNHRWVRFRTATAALSDWLQAFERGYEADPTFYTGLLDGTAKPPSYPIEETGPEPRRSAALSRLTRMRAEIAEWAVFPTDAFTDNRPLQPPILRLVPRTDSTANADQSPAGMAGSAATAPSTVGVRPS